MHYDPVFLSRLQFGFVISFHIIFPSFTIGLASWLATIEGMRLATGNEIYRRVFEFWLKVFALVRHGRRQRYRHGVPVRLQPRSAPTPSAFIGCSGASSIANQR
jgi:hypothetical protein